MIWVIVSGILLTYCACKAEGRNNRLFFMGALLMWASLSLSNVVDHTSSLRIALIVVGGLGGFAMFYARIKIVPKDRNN